MSNSHQQIKDWTLEGEGATLEFKMQITHTHKLARTISSMANNRGGKILVGVLDDGDIVGVIDVKQQQQRAYNAAKNYCRPSVPLHISIHTENYLDVMVISIEESADKPHKAIDLKGIEKTYIRTNDKTMPASRMVEKTLYNESPQPKIDHPFNSKEKALIDFLKKQETITLKRYMHLLNLSKRRARRILTELVLEGVIRLHESDGEDFYTLS